MDEHANTYLLLFSHPFHVKSSASSGCTQTRATLLYVEDLMKTQNVTLSLPKEMLQQAKLIAVQRQISLSRLLTRLIEDLVTSEQRYDRSRRHHMAILDAGYDLGTQGSTRATRDELHER